MIRFCPETLEEAKEIRYGRWTGNPNGVKYKESQCAYEVHDEREIIGRQCFRKNGFGPGKLYCKQHARIVESYYEKEGGVK